MKRMDDRQRTRCEYIVGLDLGTSSAKCMVGELSDECNLKVIGADEIAMPEQAEGDEYIDACSAAVGTLVKRVEEQTGLTIYTVYVTAGRGEIKGLNMTGSIGLNGSRITRKHCDKVLKSAERLSIPHGLEIVHVLPQKYYIDENKKVVDPIGFTARKLEVELHVVTCDSRSLNVKRRIIKNAGYYIEGMVVNALASFYGGRGLYSREKDVLIVNVGARNTDVLFFVDGQIVMTTQIMFGLNDIIGEFEYRFGITAREAEKLLDSYVKFCNARVAQARHEGGNSFTIIQKKVSGYDGSYYSDYKKISENTISLVISYMISQMIEKVKSGIIAYLKRDISSIQTVLMGGGAYLPETEREFREKFNCEIIIGENKLKSGGDLFGAAYGLLRYGIYDRKNTRVERSVGLFAQTRELFRSLSSWASVRVS